MTANVLFVEDPANGEWFHAEPLQKVAADFSSLCKAAADRQSAHPLLFRIAAASNPGLERIRFPGVFEMRPQKQPKLRSLGGANNAEVLTVLLGMSHAARDAACGELAHRLVSDPGFFHKVEESIRGEWDDPRDIILRQLYRAQRPVQAKVYGTDRCDDLEFLADLRLRIAGAPGMHAKHADFAQQKLSGIAVSTRRLASMLLLAREVDLGRMICRYHRDILAHDEAGFVLSTPQCRETHVQKQWLLLNAIAVKPEEIAVRAVRPADWPTAPVPGPKP